MRTKNIESLRTMSPAGRYASLVDQVQKKHAGPGGMLQMSPAEFQQAAAAASKIAVDGLRDVQTLFAYSAIRFEASSEVVDTTTVFTIDAGTVRKFFQYGVDDQNNVIALGGFPAGYQAQYSDTNLTKAGRPPFGSMLIQKIGFMARVVSFAESGDPQLLALVNGLSSCAVSTNGSRKQKHLGSPMFWPANLGMLGNGVDAVGTTRGHQQYGSGQGPQGMRELDEPFLWKMDGGVDDDLCVELEVDHDVELVYTTADLDVSTLAVDMWCIVEGVSAEHLSANG